MNEEVVRLTVGCSERREEEEKEGVGVGKGEEAINSLMNCRLWP